MNPKEMFGEEDILTDKKRSFSVSCTSQDGGELMIMDRQRFLDVIFKQKKA